MQAISIVAGRNGPTRTLFDGRAAVCAGRLGLGLGLELPHFVGRDGLHNGRLRRVLPEWTPESGFGPTAWVFWQPQRAMAPKLRVMADYLVEKLGRPMHSGDRCADERCRDPNRIRQTEHADHAGVRV